MRFGTLPRSDTMHRKGVTYDTGTVMGMNWRPNFDPKGVRRELQIVHDDLHCTAVRLGGHDLGRLRFATEAALALGLEVWVSPQLWDASAEASARYVGRAAAKLEPLRQQYPDRVVFVVGSEATLFSRGILPGRRFVQRMNDPGLMARIRSGATSGPLNVLLAHLVAAARTAFHGPISYASLVWEGVDWTPFDLVGVDHYRLPHWSDRYVELLRPALAVGKPVVVTEFGCEAMRQGPMSEGFLSSSGLKPSVIDVRSQFFHQWPVIGRFVRPRLVGEHVRDEQFQAEQLVETLGLLESAAVDGAFVSQFLSQITPYDPDPRYDLDMASSSLVRYIERGRGTTYPDLPWEPKEAFRAVAEFYRTH
jgi:hypothetical protein